MFIRNDINSFQKISIIICALFLFPLRFFLALFLLVLQLVYVVTLGFIFRSKNSKMKFTLNKIGFKFFMRLKLFMHGYIYVEEIRVKCGSGVNILTPIIISNH
jgi:hypothetical protein